MRTSSLSSLSPLSPGNSPSQPLCSAGRRLLGRPAQLAALLLLPGFLCAQSKPLVRHTVDGTVLDAAKHPVSGAVVYLENPKSLDVQSYLTDAQGHFHFSQISPQTDYDVWAEQNGVETRHRFISQFSSHVSFHFTLTLTPKKKKFLGIF